MSIHPVSRFLVSADKCCDYTPLLSTATNIVALFYKCIISPLKLCTLSGHYCTHLQNKSFKRCVILLIPIIGNISILLYDLFHQEKRLAPLSSLRSQNVAPADNHLPISKTVKFKTMYWDDDEAIGAIIQDANQFDFVSPTLKNNPHFVLRAVTNNPQVFRKVPSKYASDNKFLQEMIQRNPKAIAYLPAQARRSKSLCKIAAENRCFDALKFFDFNGDKEIILEVIEIQPDLNLDGIDKTLLDNADFVQRAIALKSKQAFGLASSKIKSNKAIVMQAIKLDPELLRYAKDYQDDMDVAKAVVEVSASGYKYLGEKARSDKDLLLRALESCIDNLMYTNPTLLNDPEVIRKAQHVEERDRFHFVIKWAKKYSYFDWMSS